MATFLNKNKQYLLVDKNNYKDELETDQYSIINKYTTIVIEYLIYLFESNILTKNSNILEYLINRGLATITHVFLNLLCYTKNIELVFFHCEKSFYFYLEFVSQISHEDRSFLQLSSRDACNYVYKKTIYEVPRELKTNSKCSQKSKDIINIVSINVDIHKVILHKIIAHLIKSSDNIKKLLNAFYELVTTLNALRLTEVKLITIYKFVTILHYKIDDLGIFIMCFEKLLKKIGNQPDVLNNVNMDVLHNVKRNDLNISNIDAYVNDLLRA